MYVSLELSQLKLENSNGEHITTPIEDLGAVIVDHPQVKISTPAITELLAKNVNLIYCNEKHLPIGVFTPLTANYIANKRARIQLNAGLSLKKKLWKQTVKKKILNQAQILRNNKMNEMPLLRMAKHVKSGDIDNQEGQAARYYWSKIFEYHTPEFTRDRYGAHPNMHLNYGYAILRATVARLIKSVGLLNVVGIHHHNQYNAFCLADDIMEPYRPMVDQLVLDYLEEHGLEENISNDYKAHILQMSTYRVSMEGKTTSLDTAIQLTCNSLVKCFEQTREKILYPTPYAT